MAEPLPRPRGAGQLFPSRGESLGSRQGHIIQLKGYGSSLGCLQFEMELRNQQRPKFWRGMLVAEVNNA